MTKFDSSEEAVNLLNNVKGSIENKIRASFNIGYCKGYEDGNRNAIQELERALMNMTELKAEQTEPNCSEKPNNCEDIYPCDTCKWDCDKDICGRCRGWNFYAPRKTNKAEKKQPTPVY